MRKQIITITVEGTMQGLQVKPGQGLDLTQFGPAKVVRASEIVWDETYQKWKVDVLQEAGRGVVTVLKMMFALGGEEVFCLEGADSAKRNKVMLHEIRRLAPAGCELATDNDDGVLFFNNYDDAVRVEIAYLDGLRKQGVY